MILWSDRNSPAMNGIVNLAWTMARQGTMRIRMDALLVSIPTTLSSRLKMLKTKRRVRVGNCSAITFLSLKTGIVTFTSGIIR
jgi:hypothetical protein